MPVAPVPTDDLLLERARQGDQQACRLLVERYEGVVAATVIGMLGRGADADDVGQETFVRFFRSLNQFRGDASLKTYLTRIAMNQSLRALKKRQRWRLRFFSTEDDETETLARMPDSRDVQGEREQREFVQSALQTLPAAQRSVVVLRMLEGFDTNETAEMLGIPPGTVMSRLARALEKLEDELRPLL
ncbi:MAG TPA: sigma-70 family RNA polymerase sigma factor [Rhodothermales bacterium]